MAAAPQDPGGGIAPGGLRAELSLPAPQPGGAPLVPFPAAGANANGPGEALIGIDDVQNALNRSRASVYRYSNTDPRNLNPPFNPRRLNPEYRTDQKDPLQFHPNEVARFARDVLRIKEVTVEVLNSPSTVTQELLGSILEELQSIRGLLQRLEQESGPFELSRKREAFDQSRPAA